MADTDVVNDDIKACLKNVAMQVAAMSPKYVSRDEVSQEYMNAISTMNWHGVADLPMYA